MNSAFEEALDPQLRSLLAGLDSPVKIQAYLDATPYSAESTNRSPVQVMIDRQAHCLDGALFAAAALRRIGYPPLLVDLFPEPGSDDDHVLAIFRRNSRWGAVAKSNFAGLRFREAAYRDLHELVMSYFEWFYNVNGVKTLRYYTRPLNLAALDRSHWISTETGAGAVEHRLLSLRRIPLFPGETIAGFSPMDTLTYEAGMQGVNQAGLYKPQPRG